MSSPNWSDLPPELLYKIAKSCDGTRGMWDVSRAWKSSLESVAHKVVILGSDLPLNLASRFSSLACLDLQDFDSVAPESLEALQTLPLTSLVVKLGAAKFSEEVSRSLKDLSLARLDLELTVHAVLGKLYSAKGTLQLSSFYISLV